MPNANTILNTTKYAGAKFEYGHPFNDAAYSLVYDAPLMAAKVSRYEKVLHELEGTLEQTRLHLQQLAKSETIDAMQLYQVEAALAHLRDTRRELQDDDTDE